MIARHGSPVTAPEDLGPLFGRLTALPKDDPRRSRIRDELVAAHLPPAEHLARRSSGRHGTAEEDLVQAAVLALGDAVDRFDAGGGLDFLSFAAPMVIREIRRHCHDAGRASRREELHLSVSRAGTELAQRLCRAPTPSEIAAHLGLGREEVHEGLEAAHTHPGTAIEEAFSGAPGVPTDLVLAGLDETLLTRIKALPAAERLVVGLRFARNMPQSTIAAKVGTSPAHVSRLLARALERLRDDVG